MNDLGVVGDLLGSSETLPPPCPRLASLWAWKLCPILAPDQDEWSVIWMRQSHSAPLPGTASRPTEEAWREGKTAGVAKAQFS